MTIYINNRPYRTDNEEDLRYIFSTVFNPNSPLFNQKMYDYAKAGGFAGADGDSLRLKLEEYERVQGILNNAAETGDYTAAQGEISNLGYDIGPDAEKWLDNMISGQRTAEDQAFQTNMRDTSLLSTAGQLGQLGLSGSNVIQVGGASSGVTSSAADTNMHSVAQLHQQRRINDYNQKMGIAKSLIGMVGSMASSGIYGHAIGAARNSASRLASATAHSALDVLKNSSHPQSLINQLAKNGNNFMLDKLGLG